MTEVNIKDVPKKWQWEILLNQGQIIGKNTNCIQINDEKIFTAEEGWYTSYEDKFYFIDPFTILVEKSDTTVQITRGNGIGSKITRGNQIFESFSK